MKKLRKLPKSLKFKGRYRNYVIGVEEVSRETLEELAGPSDGYWDDHSNIEAETKLDGRILIAKDIPLNEKWQTLWHEQIHLCLDLGRRDELEGDDE